MGKVESRRADLRTADLISLRVITQALQGLAETCKSRISKPVSILSVAECCTVLRSLWYQYHPRLYSSASPPSLNIRSSIRLRLSSLPYSSGRVLAELKCSKGRNGPGNAPRSHSWSLSFCARQHRGHYVGKQTYHQIILPLPTYPSPSVLVVLWFPYLL